MSGNFEKLKSKKSRQFKLLLYADNREHMQTLHYLRRVYPDNFIGVWHRLPEEPDGGGEIMQGAGKKHAHILLDFPFPRAWGAVCKDLRLSERFCWHMKYKIKTNQRGEWAFVSCKDTLEKGFVYLVHRDDQTKEQYQQADLFGSFRLVLAATQAITAYESKQVSERVALAKFQRWLACCDCAVSFTACYKAFQNTPYFVALRSPIADKLRQDHNAKYYTGWREAAGSDSALPDWSVEQSEGEIPF